jgi:hypothetical protein
MSNKMAMHLVMMYRMVFHSMQMYSKNCQFNRVKKFYKPVNAKKSLSYKFYGRVR